MISRCLFADLILDDLILDDLILDDLVFGDLILNDFVLLVSVCFLPLIGGMFILSEICSGSDKCLSPLDGGDSQRPQADVRRDYLRGVFSPVDLLPRGRRQNQLRRGHWSPPVLTVKL